MFTYVLSKIPVRQVCCVNVYNEWDIMFLYWKYSMFDASTIPLIHTNLESKVYGIIIKNGPKKLENL